MKTRYISFKNIQGVAKIDQRIQRNCSTRQEDEKCQKKKNHYNIHQFSVCHNQVCKNLDASGLSLNTKN